MDGDNGNGRVTMAILGQQMQTVIQQQSAILAQQKELLACYQDVRESQLKLDGRVTNEATRTDGEHKNLWAAIQDDREDIRAVKARDAWGTGLVGLATVLAGALAWFKP